MSTRARRFAPLALASALLLGISGCSVLEDWGVLPSSNTPVENADSPENASELTPEETESGSETESETTAEPADAGLSVPTCDTIYSASMTAQLLEEVRTSVGDSSMGDAGFGTILQDLVPLIREVRSDLRISCTWYLNASDSASVTSVAIVSGAVLDEVTRGLRAFGAGSAEAGGGMLYTIDSATLAESPDYRVTEAHYLVDVPCPTSLAEETCGVWIATNYAFGEAQPLTLDAARTLGVYST